MDSLPKLLNPNKHLKEEFVSNLDGTSMLEIAALLTIVPILVLLRHFSAHHVLGTGPRDNSHKKNDDAAVISTNLRTHLVRLTLDFLSIVLPMILFFTVLAEWTYLWPVLLGLFLILSIEAKRSTSYLKEGSQNFRASISSYRVAMMFVTCLSILAVDFRVFPRRYAKTETYGTSLMDLGVGSFVLANSLVSRQARTISSMNWKLAFKSTSPLLLLGFGRLISTSSVHYQVHVGEYGVHWNFFFTLAGVSMLTSLINVPSKYSGIIGSLILIGYQSWLMNGLNSYLLSNERGIDVISRNKEGIFSILGRNNWELKFCSFSVFLVIFFYVFTLAG